MPDRPTLGLLPAAASLGAALATTGLVCTCGLACMVALAMALNGFSESEAAPLFIGVIVLVLLANLVAAGAVSAFVLKRMGAWEAPAGKLVAAGSALLGTLSPVVCVGGFFLLGGSL